MRFWGYFATKLIAVGAIFYGLLYLLNLWLAPVITYHNPVEAIGRGASSYLMYVIVVGLWFLFACGALFLCVLDQRYRCRVCLRRLRMPVESGSWGQMLQFGRPQVEWICPYGHGTLNLEEVQITGLDSPQWRQHASMWEELEGDHKSGK